MSTNVYVITWRDREGNTVCIRTTEYPTRSQAWEAVSWDSQYAYNADYVASVEPVVPSTKVLLT